MIHIFSLFLVHLNIGFKLYLYITHIILQYGSIRFSLKSLSLSYKSSELFLPDLSNRGRWMRTLEVSNRSLQFQVFSIDILLVPMTSFCSAILWREDNEDSSGLDIAIISTKSYIYALLDQKSLHYPLFIMNQTSLPIFRNILTYSTFNWRI